MHVEKSTSELNEIKKYFKRMFSDTTIKEQMTRYWKNPHYSTDAGLFNLYTWFPSSRYEPRTNNYHRMGHKYVLLSTLSDKTLRFFSLNQMANTISHKLFHAYHHRKSLKKMLTCRRNSFCLWIREQTSKKTKWWKSPIHNGTQLQIKTCLVWGT